MDTNKTTATKSAHAFSDMTEKGATQARETYEKMGAARQGSRSHQSEFFDSA